ncbi:hypothetical protein TSUD_214080 [Trifolium subterraneum]|uniref:Uncharacterized protein n=1 Tax=Trifolium subterraneum TaxID=3900 RepID=A0A2Z6MQU4_TRISU|nr:hypothetical protein TSUD_214080 [Trifolium subterraneum]
MEEKSSNASEEDLKPGAELFDTGRLSVRLKNVLKNLYEEKVKKMMEKTSDASEEDVKPDNLLDTVLSWPIEDVLNENLYKNKVLKIPETFQSAIDYKNFFVPLLFEETRADLSSSLYGVSQAPFCEMADVEKSTQLTSPIPEARNQFIHFEHVIRLKSRHEFDEVENYIPVSGDVIAFTHIRPRSLNDLNTLKSPYRIAYVKESWKECFHNSDGSKTLIIRISVLTSKCMKMDVEYDLQNKLSSKNMKIDIGYDMLKNKELSSKNMKIDIGYGLWNNKELKLYAVYLMNMTTNVRIWNALNSISQVNIIKTVLGPRQIIRIIF